MFYILPTIGQRSDEILLANSDVKDEDNELEMEYNDALLKTILAAGNSATNKRCSSKKYILATDHSFKPQLYVYRLLSHCGQFIVIAPPPDNARAASP